MPSMNIYSMYTSSSDHPRSEVRSERPALPYRARTSTITHSAKNISQEDPSLARCLESERSSEERFYRPFIWNSEAEGPVHLRGIQFYELTSSSLLYLTFLCWCNSRRFKNALLQYTISTTNKIPTYVNFLSHNIHTGALTACVMVREASWPYLQRLETFSMHGEAEFAIFMLHASVELLQWFPTKYYII